MKAQQTSKEEQISTQPEMNQQAMEGNPIGLSQKVAEEICRELDTAVSSLFVQYHQYLKHHWLVQGPQYRELHLFFEEKYKEVQTDFDTLAERITALGGIPTCDPTSQAKKSFIDHEKEGMFGARDMLLLDRQHEGQMSERLRKMVRFALDRDDYGTEHLIKSVLVNSENRAHDLDHFLAQDSVLEREVH